MRLDLTNGLSEDLLAKIRKDKTVSKADEAQSDNGAEYPFLSSFIFPDDIPLLAYRRTGRAELVVRKIIKCPYCREKYMDVERDACVQVYRIPKGKSMMSVPGLRIDRCEICKNEVGYIIG